MTDAPKATEGDDDDEEEIAKLIKEEDINMVPESTDVSEIDKLTGMPKANGKFNNNSILSLFYPPKAASL